MRTLTRLLCGSSISGIFFAPASSAFAQEATLSASKGGTGTDSALLDAGGGGITYLLFFGGLILFVFGSLKLAASFGD